LLVANIVEAVGGVPVRNVFEHVLEIGEGLDVVELGGGDERADRCPAFNASVGSGKQVVLATERNGADRALDGIGVEFDAAVSGLDGAAMIATNAVVSLSTSVSITLRLRWEQFQYD
jgi:hypothetical protein